MRPKTFKTKMKKCAMFFLEVIGWIAVIFLAWFGLNLMLSLPAKAAVNPVDIALTGHSAVKRQECQAKRNFVEEVVKRRD